MSGVRLVLEVDMTALDNVSVAVSTATERLHAYVRSTVLPALQPAINNALNVAPGPVKTPFQFATLKSQRFYFATRKGLYRRTGRVLAWVGDLTIDGVTGLISAVNPAPHAQWVFGPRQVPGHANTGWPNKDTDKRVLALEQPAERLVMNGWLIVNRQLLRAA